MVSPRVLGIECLVLLSFLALGVRTRRSPSKPSSSGPNKSDFSLEFAEGPYGTYYGAGEVPAPQPSGINTKDSQVAAVNRSTVGAVGKPGEVGNPGHPGRPGVFVRATVKRPKGCKTVLDVLTARNMTSFLKLVESAGMTGIFSDKTTTLTIFAPTNDAMEAFSNSPGMNSEDLHSFEVASQLVLYHTIPSTIPSSLMTNDKVLSSLLEEEDSPCGVGDLTFRAIGRGLNSTGIMAASSIQGAVYGGASAARIEDSGTTACLSVVYVIDTVLLPCRHQLLPVSGGAVG